MPHVYGITQVVSVSTDHFKVSGGEHCVDMDWFGGEVDTLLASLGLPSNGLPVFLLYHVDYTNKSTCDTGGFHSVADGQPYVTANVSDSTNVQVRTSSESGSTIHTRTIPFPAG